MLCDVCKKQDATIHIQEIINNTKKVIHLCSECAVKKSQSDPAFDFGGFNLAEMLYNISESQEGIPGLTDDSKSEPTKEIIDSKAICCPNCKWPLKALRQTGRVGCPECYHVFSDVITNALGNMHRGKLHVGKKPGSVSSTDQSSNKMLELMNLQKELDEVVQREEYEKAAEIRDKINNLKEKINLPEGKDKKNDTK